MKLCPRDSLKIMICLISTGFTVAARASCFHLHYILWSNIFMDNPGLNAAMAFCPWALWQICREWNTKEQHILEKLHTECWTCVTPRSRSKAKPFNGLCLKSYIVWGGFLLSIMEIHFCIYKIRVCICVYVHSFKTKERAWSQWQRHRWLNGWGILHVLSKVLEWRSAMCGRCLHFQGEGEVMIIGTHQLPEKPVEELALHYSFDKLS